MKPAVVAIAVLALAACCPPKPPRHTITCHFADRVELIPIVNLEVRRDGRVLWNSISVDRKDLGPYFAEVGQTDPQPQIRVYTNDQTTPYATVAPVLQLMQQNKAYGVSVGTSQYPHIGKKVPAGAGSGKDENIPFLVGCWTKPVPEPAGNDEIEVAGDGHLIWSGQPHARSDLAKHLATANLGSLIRLKIAPEAPAQLVGDILFEIQWSGVERVQFETD